MKDRRAAAIVGVAGLVAGLFAFLTATEARAGFDEGPWLQNVTPTSVEVLIEGDQGDTPGILEYGTTPSYGSQTSLALYNGPNSGGEIFRGSLSGLAPDTFHYYRVTHSGQSRTGTFFTTSPPGQAFTYVVLGDTRSNSTAHTNNVQAILTLFGGTAPDLFFNTGDLVANGASEGDWDTFFQIEQTIQSKTVFNAIYGNHESSFGTLFYRYFSSHAQHSNQGYYSFDYGNAHFAIISTETGCNASSPQGQWLSADLEAAAANPDTPFRFVFFHQPGVTTGSSHSPKDCITGPVGLIDVLEAHNVDIAWAGHNHHYEHSLVNGIHHVTSGGGGAGLGGFDKTSSYTVYKASIYNFETISVGSTSYTVDSYQVDGVGGGIVGKVDTWTGTPGDGGFAGSTPSEFLPGGSGCGGAKAVAPGEPDNDEGTWASLPVVWTVILAPPAFFKLIGRRRRGISG